MNRRTLGLGAATSSAIFLGMAPIFGRQAILLGMNPLAVTGLRTLLAALLMLVAIAIFNRKYGMVHKPVDRLTTE